MEKKTFQDKTKLMQYLTTNAALEKMLEEKLQSEKVNHNQENTSNK